MCEIIEKVFLQPIYLMVHVEGPYHLCHLRSRPSFHNQCFHDYIFFTDCKNRKVSFNIIKPIETR